MWNATVIAGNARSRLAALEATLAGGVDPVAGVAAGREVVVARHLLALERLFSLDDPEGCFAEFEAAAQAWLRATAAPGLRPQLRKSWSLALEGAVLAGSWGLAAQLSQRTAEDVVPPEYDDEFAAAACLEICCRAGEATPDEQPRIAAFCSRAEEYLGGPTPVFDVLRSITAPADDFATRFVTWHEWHVREVDERLAGPSMRPFEMMLAHCWTRGLAVLRCVQRRGLDLDAAGLLVPRRFLPTTLLAVLSGGSRG